MVRTDTHAHTYGLQMSIWAIVASRTQLQRNFVRLFVVWSTKPSLGWHFDLRHDVLADRGR